MERNLNQHLSSPPTIELGEFLDGVLFSPDGTILLADDAIVVQEEDSNLVNAMPQPETTMANLPKRKLAEASELQTSLKRPYENQSLVVPSSDVKYNSDIFCMQGPISYPGNQMFRQLISSNKNHYDTLSTQEQETLSASLWSNLQDKGHRFLRSTGRDYEVLDHSKSVRKCHQALKKCKTGTKGKRDSQQQPPTKKQMPADRAELNFDDVAKTAVSSLLRNKEFANEMERNWGPDTEKRKELLEIKVCFVIYGAIHL